jgi:diguanylate cyclase (GGDEF)-like protein
VEDERRKHDDEIEEAVARLKRRISRRVRLEQSRDQLTDLPNEPALTSLIHECIEGNHDFWAAFIEVDRFKWINDEHGYQGADLLLRALADQLRQACAWFAGKTMAFRAHGDEFYLLGVFDERTPESSDEKVAKALKLMSETIAALHVRTEKGIARCTVSVGWLSTKDLATDPAVVLTAGHVLRALERAVAEAKWNRGSIVRYDATLRTDETLTQRGDCPDCRSKFVLTAKRASIKADSTWFCPNCSKSLDRPPLPEIAPAPEPQTI